MFGRTKKTTLASEEGTEHVGGINSRRIGCIVFLIFLAFVCVGGFITTTLSARQHTTVATATASTTSPSYGCPKVIFPNRRLSMPSQWWQKVEINNVYCDSKGLLHGTLNVTSKRANGSLDSWSGKFHIVNGSTSVLVTPPHCFDAGGMGFTVSILLGPNGLESQEFTTNAC